MEIARKDLIYRGTVLALIAVSAILLPGAVSWHKNGVEQTKTQIAEAEMKSAVAAFSAEIPAQKRDAYLSLGEREPLFVMQLNSQKFEPRHQNLWK